MASHPPPEYLTTEFDGKHYEYRVVHPDDVILTHEKAKMLCDKWEGWIIELENQLAEAKSPSVPVSSHFSDDDGKLCRVPHPDDVVLTQKQADTLIAEADKWEGRISELE